MKNDIIFVAGAPRSGTTVFRLMLDNHPRIVDPGEYDFLFEMVGDNGELPDLNEYKEWLSTNRIFLSQHLKIDPTLGYRDLLVSFVRQKAQPDCVLALSIHRNHHKIPFFFPDARYIHLLRDPRDAALSTIPMGWAGNAYFGVDRWIETEKSWDMLALKTEKSRIIEIKYENLVCKPQQTLCAVCNFLNVDFEMAMLNYQRNSTYGPPSGASVRNWTTKIRRKDLATLEHKISALLLARGYELSGIPIHKPSRLELAFLWAENWIYKWRFRTRRYGIPTSLAGKLSRVLGINWLSRRVRLATNEIDALYLK